jgi:hypothetical protein
LDKRPPVIVQVKFNPQWCANGEFLADAEFEFKPVARNVDNTHIAFADIAVFQAIEKNTRQVGVFPVLAAFFQGNFEMVAAVAFAIYGHLVFQRRILGNIDGADITALGAYEGGGIGAADKDFLIHSGLSPKRLYAVGSAWMLDAGSFQACPS